MLSTTSSIVARRFGFEPLNFTNYAEWASNMKQWLRSEDLWDCWQPSFPFPSDSSEAREIRRQKIKVVASLLLCMDKDEKLHFEERFGDASDPAPFWKAIAARHSNQTAGSRFHAYSALFDITQRDDESIADYFNRIGEASRLLVSLRPDSFDLSAMDDELRLMVAIRGAKPEYAPVSQNMLTNTSLTLDVARTAYLAVENGLKATSGMATALKASTPGPSSSPVPTRSLSSTPHCDHCDRDGHASKDCRKYAAWQNSQKSGRALKSNANNLRSSANVAATSTIPEAANAVASPSEFVANVSSFSAISNRLPADLWNADTGATSHMSAHHEWFQDLTLCSIPVTLADGKVILAKGRGSIRLQPVVGGISLPLVTLTNVLYVPGLQANLISVLTLTTLHHYTVKIEDNTLSFIRDNELWFTATASHSKSAYFDGFTLPQESANFVAAPLDSRLWHRRFGHIGKERLQQLLSSDLVKDLKVVSPNSKIDTCEACIHGKQTRLPIPKSVNSRRSQILSLIHSDVHGPTHIATASGHRYWVTFTDDATRYRAVYLLKKKSETFDAFKQFKSFAETQTGLRIKALRDDKGGEYMSNDFNSFLADHGITREHTTRATPQQNGVSERTNRILDEGITTLLHEANLPSSFWNHALSVYIHALNRSPTFSLENQTPYEAWFNRKPSVDHFRVFGCRAWVHVQKDQRKSFQSKTRKCIFIGYPSDYKAWNCYDPVSRQVYVSRDVIFDENNLPGLSYSKSNPEYSPVFPPGLELTKSTPDVSHSGGDNNRNDSDDSDDWEPLNSSNTTPTIPLVPKLPQIVPLIPLASPPIVPASGRQIRKARRAERQQTEPVRRSTRQTRPPGEWWKVQPTLSPTPEPSLASSPGPSHWREPTPAVEISDDEAPAPKIEELSSDDDSLNLAPGETDDLFLASTVEESASTASQAQLVEYAHISLAHEPRTFKAAMQTDEAELWKLASQEEISSLHDHNTWELTELPAGHKALGVRWVYKRKEKSDGSTERYKARLVVQGYSQVPFLHFVETFAPVAKFTSLRAVLAIAAIEDMEIDHLDVSSAFLNGDLDEEIYVKQPEGFTVPGKEHHVYRLKKSLYGLKQSPRQWYLKLHDTFVDLGFKRLPSDNSIYVWAKDKVKVIIPVYVDDLTMACNDLATRAQIKSELATRFKIRDLGPIQYILGMQVYRDRPNRRLYLCQKKYTQDIISKFNLQHLRPVTTPLDKDKPLTTSQCPTSDDEKKFMSTIPYLSAVGSLMYLSVGTRPDITHAVSIVSRFSHNPGREHWAAVQRIYQYLNGTLDYSLQYGDSPSSSIPRFNIYSDSDYAGSDDAKSTSGYALFVGNSCVSWASKRQGVVARSTTEAEYVAANAAGGEAMFFRNLFEELGYPCHHPTPLKIDNLSTISVSKNPEHPQKMKHINVAFHWLRQAVVEDKTLSVEWTPSIDNTADILTKALPRVLHERHCVGLGLVRLQE
jgi:hypothetical protein